MEGSEGMDGNQNWVSAPPMHGTRVVWVCLGVVTWLGVSGCAEHRISLGEFLEIQQTMSAKHQEQASRQDTPLDLGAHLGPYRVGPDDVLAIQLVGADGNPLFPAVQARIDRNGEVELPVVKAVKVADKELQDVEDLIRQAYVPGVYREAVCHVELLSTDVTNVLVVGAVTEPGLVPLRRTERNLLFAIVGAGGASEIASGQTTLRRIGHPAEEVTLDLRDPVHMRAALALEPLEDGDIVNVHSAQPNRIFVGGLVNRAGPQDYPPGSRVTVLQALAAANGLRTDIFPKVGTLIRSMPDGKDFHVKLDLDRLARGDDPNVALAAGDILWVPETFGTRVQDFLNRNIFMRAGISVNYNVTGVEFLNRRGLQARRTGGGTLQDTYDPLGFLTPNTVLPSTTMQP